MMWQGNCFLGPRQMGTTFSFICSGRWEKSYLNKMVLFLQVTFHCKISLTSCNNIWCFPGMTNSTLAKKVPFWSPYSSLAHEMPVDLLDACQKSGAFPLLMPLHYPRSSPRATSIFNGLYLLHSSPENPFSLTQWQCPKPRLRLFLQLPEWTFHLCLFHWQHTIISLPLFYISVFELWSRQ